MDKTTITGMVTSVRALGRIAWFVVRTEYGDKQVLLSMSDTENFRDAYDNTNAGDDIQVAGEVGHAANGGEIIKARLVEKLWHDA